MSATSAFDIFNQLDPPLWLVTAQVKTQRSGLIATFVNQASITPQYPRVVVGLAQQHFTWHLVEMGGSFVLHLLSERRLDWVWRFGLQTGYELDKFQDLEMTSSATGNPIIKGAMSWLDCRVESKMSTGDRTIYLAEVVDSGVNDNGPHLTLQQMLNLAPDDKIDELKRQMIRDRAVDADAIERWRRKTQS